MRLKKFFQKAVDQLRFVPASAPGVDLVAAERKITDDWFRSHYGYAADIVADWLGKEIDLSASCIVDFGCGDGIMDLGLALKHQPKAVVGVDIHDAHKYLEKTAQDQLGIALLPSNLRFVTVAAGDSLRSIGPIDALFSWSVFEHVERHLLPAIFADAFNALAKGGVFFLQIEPLYYSPFGSHLSGLLSEPWAHLLLSNEELLEEIDQKQPEQMSDEHKNKTFELCTFNDFKEYLKREYRSLNRITSTELIKIVEGAGFVVDKKRLNTTDLMPPARLRDAHSEHDLRCTELMLLLRRPG